mgnify:CR=1 FL=1
MTGVQTCALPIFNEGEEYVVLLGHHRYDALKAVNDDLSLTCRFIPQKTIPTLRDVVKFQLHENDVRSSITLWDRTKSYKLITESDPSLTKVEVAKDLRVDSSQISRYSKINEQLYSKDSNRQIVEKWGVSSLIGVYKIALLVEATDNWESIIRNHFVDDKKKEFNINENKLEEHKLILEKENIFPKIDKLDSKNFYQDFVTSDNVSVFMKRVALMSLSKENLNPDEINRIFSSVNLSLQLKRQYLPKFKNNIDFLDYVFYLYSDKETLTKDIIEKVFPKNLTKEEIFSIAFDKYLSNIDNEYVSLDFLDKKMTFNGFADFWYERNTNFLNARDELLAIPTQTQFVFITEPQLWWNITPYAAVGTELEMSVNFGSTDGFKICPTIGAKYTF